MNEFSGKLNKEEERNQADILEYGLKEYKEYNLFNARKDDLEKILAIIKEGNAELVEQINNLDENYDRIVGFFSEEGDPELERILDLMHFDIDQFIESEDGEITSSEMGRIFVEINKLIIKEKGYREKVEKKSGELPEFSGFENDEDISDAREVFGRMFDNKLVDKCLISNVNYYPETVTVWLGSNEGTFYLPMGKYKEWRLNMPEIVQHKTRAENFASWNEDHSFSYQMLEYPIEMYSFIDEDVSKVDHLSGFADEEKMRRFKMGTLSHEVAHHIYDYLVGDKLREEWKKVVDGLGRPVTEYAEKYRKGIHGREINYEEEFSEVVRLRTTSPEYLKDNFTSAYEFLEREFPEIRSM